MPFIKNANNRVNVNPYVWFIVFFVFFFLLYILRSVLMPFVAGILVAYLLDPMVDKLQKFKISRTCATLIVCVLTVLVVLPMLGLLLGMIENQVSLLLKITPKYLGLIMDKINPLLANLIERFPELKDANLEEVVKGNIGNALKIAGKVLKGVISNSFAILNIVSF